MLREKLLRKHISKEKLGLEIGPLFWGLCRKDEGYNVLIWDVLSKEELLNNYKTESKSAKKELEEIDIISSKSMKIALSEYSQKKDAVVKNVSECFEYIISSHNLEHMPNPIQFLIDASELLKEDGILNMAIPISSRCFDCFRPLSTTGEMLDAYISKNKKPSFGKYFDHSFSTMGILEKNNKLIDVNDITYDFNKLTIKQNLSYSTYQEIVENYNKTPYVDNHVWQFNLESFISIFEDLMACKIIKNLEIIDAEIIGIEFIISIRKKKSKKQFLISNERRLSLKKASLIAYFSDLIKQNINIFIRKKSFEVSNQKSFKKKLKNQLIKKFLFFTKKILYKTLSENKYQSIKNIYQKIKNK